MNVDANQNKSTENVHSNPPRIQDQLEQLRNDIVLGDDREQAFFEHCVTPAFVLHIPSEVFIDVNDPFQELFGYQRSALLDGSVRAEELIHPTNQNLMKLVRNVPERIPSGEYTANGMDRSGNTFPVLLEIRSRSINDQPVLYGLVREISAQKEKERMLRKQLNDVVQANNQMLAFIEKIQEVPGLTSELMNRKTSRDVFQTVKEKACERKGLNFEEVQFYLLDETTDELKPLEDDSEHEPIPLSSDHPAVKIATGEEQMAQSDEDTFVLPLRGPDKPLGVLMITLSPQERKLLKGNTSIWDGFKESLVILSDLLGLILQDRDRHDES